MTAADRMPPEWLQAPPARASGPRAQARVTFESTLPATWMSAAGAPQGGEYARYTSSRRAMR